MGADPEFVGRRLTWAGSERTLLVIGIAPAGFDYPVDTNRPNTSAEGMPIAMPIASSRSTSRMTSQITSPLCAPSTSRMPSSRLRPRAFSLPRPGIATAGSRAAQEDPPIVTVKAGSTIDRDIPCCEKNGEKSESMP
jgi:hypothetical protein